MAKNKKGIDYDELKSQVEGVWSKALDALTKGKREVVRYSQIGKIKLDQQMMERDKSYLFQKMGEEAYKGLKAGNLKADVLEKYMVKIEAIDKKIKAQGQKLSGLTKKTGKTKSKKK